MEMSRVHVGLSGYSYKPWQGEGRFYPPGLKQKEFLEFYASRYETVEIDATWYRMPSESSVRTWVDNTPDGFTFAFKAHRTITHIRRLKPECQEALQFMVQQLAPAFKARKVSSILVQLPPNMKVNAERLQQFLTDAPKELEGVPIPYALEFREDSWNVAAIEEVLSAHNVAWVAAETDETPAQKRDTAEFHYVRLRKSAYEQQDLKNWSDYFKATGKDCFVYCKHEDEGSPWVWADRLLELGV